MLTWWLRAHVRLWPLLIPRVGAGRRSRLTVQGPSCVLRPDLQSFFVCEIVAEQCVLYLALKQTMKYENLETTQILTSSACLDLPTCRAQIFGTCCTGHCTTACTAPAAPRAH